MWVKIMDISNWKLDQILRLPESAFGQKDVIQLYGRGTPPQRKKDISSVNLPEHTVIWQVNINQTELGIAVGHVTLRLGTRLPASDAEFDRMEPIFSDVIDDTGNPSSFIVRTELAYSLSNIRKYIQSKGRRIVAEFGIDAGGVSGTACQIVYSSIPREIPDFYRGSPMDHWEELIRLVRIGAKLPGGLR